MRAARSFSATGSASWTTFPSMVTRVRAWDLAATPEDKRKTHDPDFTAGVLIGKAKDATLYILDVRRVRRSPQQVQELVRQTAEEDGRSVAIWMEQEPGSAGVALIDHYQRHVLHGYNFRALRSTGSKADRAQPLAALAEGGTVKLLRAHWNGDFLDEMEAFPFGRHDDMVDAACLALWSGDRSRQPTSRPFAHGGMADVQGVLHRGHGGFRPY